MYSNNDGNGIDKIRKVDLMVDENMVYKMENQFKLIEKLHELIFSCENLYIFYKFAAEKLFFCVILRVMRKSQQCFGCSQNNGQKFWRAFVKKSDYFII